LPFHNITAGGEHERGKNFGAEKSL
jgi:hypothetical protein